MTGGMKTAAFTVRADALYQRQGFGKYWLRLVVAARESEIGSELRKRVAEPDRIAQSTVQLDCALERCDRLRGGGQPKVAEPEPQPRLLQSRRLRSDVGKSSLEALRTLLAE